MMEEILRPGTEVKIKKQFGVLPNAIISAVFMAGGSGGVQYELCYFYSGDLKKGYIPREMFDVVTEEPVGIGFRLKE